MGPVRCLGLVLVRSFCSAALGIEMAPIQLHGKGPIALCKLGHGMPSILKSQCVKPVLIFPRKFLYCKQEKKKKGEL